MWVHGGGIPLTVVHLWCCLSVVARYQLKADVRQSLYDGANEWMEAVGPNRPFLGGNQPNLADLVSLWAGSASCVWSMCVPGPVLGLM